MSQFSICNAEARHLIRVAHKIIETRGEPPIVIAVLGKNCFPVAIDVMDGAMPASIKLAECKAYTAIATDRDTILWQRRDPQINVKNFGDRRLSFLGGGIQIFRDGQVIGALGISGKGGGEKDHEIAVATRMHAFYYLP